jgi:2-(1,2-epoxy-1,2-dihydrophenyl)acetyl-CoA isomerase
VSASTPPPAHSDEDRAPTSVRAGGPARFGDVEVTLDDAYVATIEIQRPPDNYFDPELIHGLADAIDALDRDPGCRAIVLCSQGKNFCAGANFSARRADGPGPFDVGDLYGAAARLLEGTKPIVAAVQGAAVGGGLGVACVADFRVATTSARFAANFARLGFHHGFGLTVTLPAIIGQQRALELLYTGRRIDGATARALGLVDALIDGDVRAGAHGLAAEIAASAPLAVSSIRETMRGHLAQAVREATIRELAEQARLRQTADWAEGVRAAAERRPPLFEGR